MWWALYFALISFRRSNVKVCLGTSSGTFLPRQGQGKASCPDLLQYPNAREGTCTLAFYFLHALNAVNWCSCVFRFQGTEHANVSQSGSPEYSRCKSSLKTMVFRQM